MLNSHHNSAQLQESEFAQYHIDTIDSVPVLKIRHAKASASIALQGAQILSFKPTGKPDLLWLSEAVMLDGKTAIRGGIPICWPWFGKGGSPGHGFARLSFWQLDSVESCPESATVCLSLHDSPETRVLYPYQFALTMTVTISDSLKAELKIQNRDTQPFSFTGALHSYFAVDDVARCWVHGLGDRCLNSVDGGETISVTQPLSFTKAIDYVFHNGDAVDIHNTSHLTRISSSQADSMVVWTPWQDGAKAIPDMAQHEYKQMICIEPAIFRQAITLQSGESFTLDLLAKSVPDPL